MLQNTSASGVTFQNSLILCLQVNDQQMECVAHNGVGADGVYAVARCCVISGLQCRVHASPEVGRDAECSDPQHQLTGESQSAPVKQIHISPVQSCNAAWLLRFQF